MCSEPKTIDVTEKAVDAMSAMENPRKITFLPVVASTNVLVGLVTLHGPRLGRTLKGPLVLPC